MPKKGKIGKNLEILGAEAYTLGSLVHVTKVIFKHSTDNNFATVLYGSPQKCNIFQLAHLHYMYNVEKS